MKFQKPSMTKLPKNLANFDLSIYFSFSQQIKITYNVPHTLTYFSFKINLINEDWTFIINTKSR